jgi:hypothetical protein
MVRRSGVELASDRAGKFQSTIEGTQLVADNTAEG